MSTKIRLGAFVFIALAAFALMVFWIGDRQSIFSRTYRISAPFDNVAGLEEGAPVRAGGVRISPHGYATMEEVDRLIDELRKL